MLPLRLNTWVVVIIYVFLENLVYRKHSKLQAYWETRIKQVTQNLCNLEPRALAKTTFGIFGHKQDI